MKSRNFWKLLLTLVIMLTVLTGCFLDKTFTYSFRQDRSNIEKVEICAFDYYNGKEITPITQMRGESVDILLAELSVLKCYLVTPFDPTITFGDKVICITYLNGEVEVIGKYNVGWISDDGKWHYSRYCFESRGINAIIERYAKY